MFKQKTNKALKIDTLVGPKTRINGDVEFVGGFHLDGQITATSPASNRARTPCR